MVEVTRRLGNFGEGVADRAAALEVYTELKAALAWAWTKFYGAAAGMDGGAQVKTQLAAVGDYIDKLSPSGAITARLLSGEKSRGWWLAAARDARGRLDAAVKDFLGPFGYASRFWNEVVAPTASGVRDAVAASTRSIMGALPWVSLGLIAVAVMYVLPRRSTVVVRSRVLRGAPLARLQSKYVRR